MTSVSFDLVLGAGPVGSTLALRLAARGTRVRLVTRSGAGPAHELIELVRADVTDVAAAEALGRGARVVFSCVNAPYRADTWRRVWPLLQAGGLAAARAGGGRYVATDNLYMYGPSQLPVTERTAMTPAGEKGRLRAELADALFSQNHVPAASVRAGDFVGPLVLGSHVGARFVPRVLAGRPVRVVGDPDAPHAFTYVPDLVDTLIAVADSESATGRPWHAPVVTVSQRRLAEAIAGGPSRVSGYPRWFFAAGLVVPMIRELAETLYQFDRPFLVDDSDVVAAFGLRPTPLPEVAAATRRWWQEREHGAGAGTVAPASVRAVVGHDRRESPGLRRQRDAV